MTSVIPAPTDTATTDRPPVPGLVKLLGLSSGTLPAELSAGTDPALAWIFEQLRSLELTAQPEEELQSAALTRGGPTALFRWVEYVRRLDTAGMLIRTITVGGELLCSIRPLGTGPSDRPPTFDPAAGQRLSRMTMIRAADGELIAQHPSSHLAVVIGRLSTEVLGMLAGWTHWQEIEKNSADLTGEMVRAVLGQLARAAVLEQDSDAGDSSESSTARTWNPFDWWMHSRSRNPRSVAGWGGTYPGKGLIDRLPALPEPFGGRVVPLPSPDLDSLISGGRSLTAVMEARRSIREHDDEHPVTLDQLGELLFRSARTRAVVSTSPGTEADTDEILDRPYPGGGALHELELYTVVRLCTGLDAGIWHYRSADHALQWVSGMSEPVEQLLWAAQSASNMTAQPQVLLEISSRFGRLMYKYEAIAYSLTLKHVGVLMQNLYLVSTDMGIAPTAIGSGDAGAFAMATGRDPMVEGSVGEFMVGSRPTVIAPGPLSQWKD